jgi:hypothetical protein
MWRLFPVILALGILLAAGCGGSARDDFSSSVVDSRNTVDGALAHITDNPESKQELLSRMETSAEQIDRAADDLDSDKPPAEFKTQQGQLVTAYRQLAVDVSTAAKELRSPEFQSMVANSRGLSFQSFNRVNTILVRLKAKGIDVKPLGRH